MEELKPCPFCGGDNVSFEPVLGRRKPYGLGTIVKCGSCGCQTSVAWHKSSNNYDGEPEAAEAWNTRAEVTE